MRARLLSSLLLLAPVSACADLAASREAVVATAHATHEPIVWDLTDLYASPEAWNAEHGSVEAGFSEIAPYRGRLGESAATLADAYDTVSGLYERALRLTVYAGLKADEDTRIDENAARYQRAEQLFSEFGQAIAWMTPELLTVGEAKVDAFIAAEPRLSKHAFALHDALRAAPHTRTAEEEALLSAASLPLGGPARIRNQLANSDIDWPTLSIDGEDLRLDSQGYVRARQNPDRAVRKQVFDAFFGKWSAFESSLGQTLGAEVQGHVFDARARDFADARAAAMFPDALPPAIYDMMIEQAHAGLPTLYRYYRLRARMLGVDDLAYYDIYPELVSLDQHYTVDEAEDIALQALAPFGDEYLDVLRTGFAGDWMHAYPQQGKASGAYMSGDAYRVHPYLLLNFQDDYDSLSTFVHEWGHAVHTMLADEAQPFETSGYATFVAEMASTVNEVLLMRHMYDHASTDDERLYFLDKELELYRGTFFRQAMFAEFEDRIHKAAEAGEPATGEAYTKIYLDLLRTYQGADQGVMQIDSAYAVEWAYVPHFYYDYYVYQYATSVTASTAFVERLESGDPGARDAVIDMLKKGGSEHPYDMFVDAGVDLTTPGPYQAVMRRMSEIMDEMDAVLDRRGAGG